VLLVGRRNFPIGPGGITDDASERRRRCESRAPGFSCTFCVARGLPCSSGEPGKGIHGHDEPKFAKAFYPRQTDSCSLPTKSLCAELVQLYFDYVHDQFHTLFHPPSFVEEMNRGQAPRILLYGMMALSARYVLLLLQYQEC
jgi:Fungal specific transcription factor domain.